LSDQDAIDVADFVANQPRPVFAGSIPASRPRGVDYREAWARPKAVTGPGGGDDPFQPIPAFEFDQHIAW
jgi:hypothetical protein